VDYDNDPSVITQNVVSINDALQIDLTGAVMRSSLIAPRDHFDRNILRNHRGPRAVAMAAR